MEANELKKYKQALDAKNKDYDRNNAYYLGKNPVILLDKKLDKWGFIENQDRRIPLPIARKMINTLVGFQFSDIQYKETGRALSIEANFSNLMTNAKKEIPVEEETDYFKYFKTINEYNDNDVLDLETAISACNHGRAYKIYYYDSDRMLKCDIVPTNEICPVYTDTLNPVMEKAIRYYNDKEYTADGKVKDVYYAEVFTPEGIEYYIAEQQDYSDAKVDPDKGPVVYAAKGVPQKMHVVEYNIFRDKTPLVAHLYGMIDEIDRVISKNVAEELAGFKAAILKISNYLDDVYRDDNGQTALDRFKKTNILQGITKDDIAEWLTKNIQDSFIFGAYDRLKKDLFEYADIPNFSDGESWGSTISGVSAGFRLLGFLFLADQTFRIWQEGKRMEIDLINAYSPLVAGSESIIATMNELKIISNRKLPKNILENAQIAGMLKGLVPNSDLLAMFPEIVTDVNGAIDELEDQLENESKRLMDSITEPNTTGENNNGMSDKEETEEA
jgi:SPP1 family phage portal protein